MTSEELENFVDFINDLAVQKYFGEVVVKFEDGKIVIGERKEKIKFDNRNYLVYKSKSK